MNNSLKRVRITAGIIGALVVIVIAAYVLFAKHIVYEYETISEETENLYAEKIIDSYDRTLKSYMERYSYELEYLLQEDTFQDEEERLLAENKLNELLTYFQEHVISQQLTYTSMLALDNDTILLSYDLSKGQILPGDIITTINRKGCICKGKDGDAYLAFCKRSKRGIVYGVFIELDEFFNETLGRHDSNEYYQISLYDANNGYFVHQIDRTIIAMREDEIDENGDDHGFGWIKSASEKESISTDLIESSKHSSDESYRARLHTVPAMLTNNERLTIAVSINYDMLSEPLHQVISHSIIASIAATLMLLICVIAMVLNMHRHNTMVVEVNALKDKNRELTLFRENMNTNLHHQRLETIGTLTSGISHEFNNLLAPIMGYSIMALEKCDDNIEMQEYLTEIYDSASRAKALVRRISDLSRKNSDQTLVKVLFDPAIEKGIPMPAVIKSSGAKVEKHFGAGGVYITANIIQISQMILNLVVNAAQAIEEHEIKEGLIVIRTWADGERAYVSVEDNGPGITKEEQEKIFQPFYTTKESGKGTGLGLAIVQQVVEEHQGHIELESECGVGTTFTISFPLLEVSETKNVEE